MIFVFGLLLVCLLLINYIQAINIEEIHSREKRLFFKCAKIGKKCGGLMGKSCCSGSVCHSTFHKCVRQGSGISWLADRNEIGRAHV